MTDSPKLSKKAAEVFSLGDQGRAMIIVPAIVLLECIDILDKKKVALEFEEIMVKIAQADNFVISEINWGLILEVNQTKGIKDLHDRIIIASQIFGASIICKDRFIKNFYSRTVW